MSENYTIAGFRILSVNCDIADIYNAFQEKENDGITLKVEDKMSYRRTSAPSESAAQLDIRTNITSDVVPNFKISLFSQVAFIFKDTPENMEDVLEDECYPIAREMVYSAIKKITDAMGIPPIDLSGKQEPG